MTRLTNDQIAALQAPLNRDNVKGRKQAGREVSYIESWFAEAEANRIFGYDGWDSTIKDLRLVSEREVTIGKGGNYEKSGWSVSYVCTVRVDVCIDGAFVTREGVGAGHGIDADPGQAHESAVKEAASDAEKRALKTWGNQFGLALYDKTQANVAAGGANQNTQQQGAPKAMLTVTTAKIAMDNCGNLDALAEWHRANKAHIDALPDDDYKAIGQYWKDRRLALSTGQSAAA